VDDGYCNGKVDVWVGPEPCSVARSDHTLSTGACGDRSCARGDIGEGLSEGL
jgi:hypothetical protein